MSRHGASADDPDAPHARDLALYYELAAAGFQGRAWQRFAEELARYGWAVIHAWLSSGEIFAQCSRRQRAVGTMPLYWTDDDRFSLAQDTVVAGLRLFRAHGMVRHKWIADGGASLTTYFIGACVLAFPNVYRAWRKEYHDERAVGRTELIDDFHQVPAGDPGPATIAVNRSVLDSALAPPVAPGRRAVVLQELGCTRVEIGELLALADGATMPYSEAMVKGWLSRERHRGRGQREEGSADDGLR
jgi:hypothetical protein